MSEKRLYKFDNAKFILILLVIFAHLLELILEESILARSIYIFIYSFHMPALIFIAGYFSKFELEFKTFLLKHTKRLLIPYLIFQLLYLNFNQLLLFEEINLSLFLKFPFWIMWFLFSLFSWEILSYFLLKIKISAFKLFLIAGIAAILIGFLNQFNRMFSLSRTVVFFPFFLFGYYFKQHFKAHKIKEFLSEINKNQILLVFGAEIIFISLFLDSINLEIIYGALSYHNLNISLYYGLLSRIIFLSAAFINSFLFFKIIPASKSIISSYGARSIYPYLLHGFIVIIFKKYDLFSSFSPLLAIIIYLMLTVFLIIMLTNSKVRKIFSYLIEFK